MEDLITACLQFEDQFMVGNFDKPAPKAAIHLGVITVPASIPLVRNSPLAKIDR
jgi:hypothetical protein